MTLYLVRHGKAGSRGDFDGADHLRPLSRKGRAQAEALATLLAPEPVARVLTSPYMRCRQTVEPLAAKLGLPIEDVPALAEGAAVAGGVALLRSLAGTTAVLCTHGDVVPALLDELVFTDGVAVPPDYRCAKGSTWVLTPDDGGRFVAARYLPPPA